MTRSVRAAIAQFSPIPFAIDRGLADLHARCLAAADAGAQIVAFGESFIGGYPLWFDHAAGAAMWNQPGAKALHRILLDRALVTGDPRLAPIQAVSDRAGLLISFGAHERVRSSLYNAQYLIRPAEQPLLHRKLVPTHGERLLWARGDGGTLDVHDAPWGRVGSLICWEHWMPLARAAMHHCAETVHVAAWPTVNDTHLLASRSYAFEGRCFVLAAGTIQSRSDLLDGLALVGGDGDGEALLRTMPDRDLQFGNSAIIAPNGEIVAQAGAAEELLVADLDLDAIAGELALLDSDGHYSRPDVFQLTIDRRDRLGVQDRSIFEASSPPATPAIRAG